MDELQAAMEAGTSPAVQLWMNWMLAIFALSILFVWKHIQARWALGTLILTGICGYFLWTMTKNVHLLGIVHLILWTPMAYYLWHSVLSKKSRPYMREYKFFFLWAAVLFATIVISLLFDVRDIYLVLTGAK